MYSNQDLYTLDYSKDIDYLTIDSVIRIWIIQCYNWDTHSLAQSMQFYNIIKWNLCVNQNSKY